MRIMTFVLPPAVLHDLKRHLIGIIEQELGDNFLLMTDEQLQNELAMRLACVLKKRSWGLIVPGFKVYSMN